MSLPRCETQWLTAASTPIWDTAITQGTSSIARLRVYVYLVLSESQPILTAECLVPAVRNGVKEVLQSAKCACPPLSVPLKLRKSHQRSELSPHGNCAKLRKKGTYHTPL